MICFEAAGGTDTGSTRARNQDSFGAKVLTAQCGEIAAAIMCDGMGGYANGEVASATVVDAFQRWILRRLPVHCAEGIQAERVFDEWCGLIELCNQKIMRYGEAHGVQLGTTAAMLLVMQEQYFIMNIGDCRVYEIGETVQQITRDQTLVERELAAGLLTPEEAENDSRSHILAECVGIVPEIHPDMYIGKTAAERVFMLCCDGFRHQIGQTEFLTYLAPEHMHDSEQMQKQLRALIDLNMERGETDNISVIAVRSRAAEQQAAAEFAVLQEFCFTGSTELAE